MEIYDYTDFAVGIACLGYGLFTLVMRTRRPESFGKLEPMKKFWGPKRGKIIHIIGYTVIPLVVGTIFLLTALAPRT